MTATLPTLTGSPQDIREGNIERGQMLDHLGDEIAAKAAGAPADLTASLVDLYREVALRQTDAAWWINNQHRSAASALGPIVQKLFTADDRARLAALAAKRTA